MSLENNACWRPTATLETLKRRAKLIQRIRAFFIARDVLEVETPLLAHHGVTDCHVENINAQYQGNTLFLQTSPEYHMKRLLCAEFPSIFQISKAFRDEACGRKHNSEFTMLEWYRLGFSLEALMDEVCELLQQVLGRPKAKRMTYQAVFVEILGVNPHVATTNELKQIAIKHGLGFSGELSRDAWLDLLMGCLIEPKLGFNEPLMIFDYPKSQSALAVVCDDVAKRFEVYVDGIELANGFDELGCANEQATRFKRDNDARRQAGLNTRELDSFFLNALTEGGLPSCAGVALGIDRLLMCLIETSDIQEVIAFPLPVA